MSDLNITNNTLMKKYSLISFDSILYKNYSIYMNNLEFKHNTLSIGQMIHVGSNCKLISLANSTIINNKAQFLLLEPGSSDPLNPLNFFIDNGTFIANNGINDAIIQIKTNSKIIVKSSIFIENYSFGRGSVIFADYQAAYALFQDCSFLRNYAYVGGVFYVSYLSTIEVQTSKMIENFAVTGGVAYVNNDGNLNINNGCVITQNQALNTCFLFAINSYSDSHIDNVTISKNDQMHPVIKKEDFLAINDTYKHIQKPYFDYLKTIKDKVSKTIIEKFDSSILAINSYLTISNTLIFENDVLLSASAESQIAITNTDIVNVTITNKMIQSVLADMTLQNVTFKNISEQAGTNSQQYLISIESQSNYTALNISMENINNLLYYATESQILITNFNFENITNKDYVNPMIAMDNSQVQLINGSIRNVSQFYTTPLIKQLKNNGTFYNISVSDFDKTIFLNQNGQYSFNFMTITNYTNNERLDAPFMIENSLVFNNINSNVTIDNSDIMNIISNFSSPVVMTQNDYQSTTEVTLRIRNSSFSNNAARTDAGVIESINTNVIIESSIFDENHAISGSGGVMKLDCEEKFLLDCYYSIKDSLFTNNMAMLNGGVLQYTFYKPDISQNNTFINNSAQYGDIQAAYPIQLDLVTVNQTLQIKLLDNVASKKLGVNNAAIFELQDYLVSGDVMAQKIEFALIDSNGEHIITDSSSEATLIPLDTQNVQILKSRTVTAIEGVFTFDDVIVIAEPGSDILLQITTDAINQAKIRSAQGQQSMDIYIKAHMRICDRGEYQTSDHKCVVCSDGFYTLETNSKSCNECPSYAVCQEGFKILPFAGYWRENVNSTSIFKCQNADACISAYETICSPGYGGNLCQSCIKYDNDYYSRTDSNICSECIDLQTNSLRLAGVAILIIVYYFILVVINIKTSGQQKFTTAYMRILTNYFQILTLAQSYDLSWEYNLQKFLEAISFIAQSTDMMISQDCFIKETVNNLHPLYVKIIIACLFPLVVILIICFSWYIIGIIKKDKDYLNHMLVSVIVLIFVCISPIISLTFQIFNCSDIFLNGNSFLVNDNSLQCWSGDHAFYSKSFGIPIIIIWILGLPLVALIILYQRRTQLNEASNMTRFGFLYVGLNHNAFYWEILIHFRKVAMITVNVFFTSFQPLYRFATFYGGLFFISGDIPFTMSIIFFACILGLNLSFWLSWFKLMFTNIYERIFAYINRYLKCLIRQKRVRKSKTNLEEFNELQQDDESMMYQSQTLYFKNALLNQLNEGTNNNRRQNDNSEQDSKRNRFSNMDISNLDSPTNNKQKRQQQKINDSQKKDKLADLTKIPDDSKIDFEDIVPQKQIRKSQILKNKNLNSLKDIVRDKTDKNQSNKEKSKKLYGNNGQSATRTKSKITQKSDNKSDLQLGSTFSPILKIQIEKKFDPNQTNDRSMFGDFTSPNGFEEETKIQIFGISPQTVDIIGKTVVPLQRNKKVNKFQNNLSRKEDQNEIGFEIEKIESLESQNQMQEQIITFEGEQVEQFKGKMQKVKKIQKKQIISAFERKNFDHMSDEEDDSQSRVYSVKSKRLSARKKIKSQEQGQSVKAHEFSGTFNQLQLQNQDIENPIIQSPNNFQFTSQNSKCLPLQYQTSQISGIVTQQKEIGYEESKTFPGHQFNIFDSSQQVEQAQSKVIDKKKKKIKKPKLIKPENSQIKQNDSSNQQENNQQLK